jgi:hypothetical protein
LLIIDNAHAYPEHLDDNCPNVKVMVLPPYTKSSFQLVDQGIIANLQTCYLKTTFGVWISGGLPSTRARPCVCVKANPNLQLIFQNATAM